MNWRAVLMVTLCLVLADHAMAAAAVWPDLSRPPEALDQTIMAKDWATARDAIGTALAASYRPGARLNPGSTGQAVFKSWLLMWQWCDLLARDRNAEADRFLSLRLRLPPGQTIPQPIVNGEALPAQDEAARKVILDFLQDTPQARRIMLNRFLAGPLEQPQPKPLATLVPSDILTEWTSDEKLLRLLMDNLSPADNTAGVLENLAQIRRNDPKRFRDHLALAIAIAVVYDQRLPSSWPHAQVEPDLVPVASYQAADLFNIWLKLNESPKRLVDLDTLPVEQVKFAVDAPLKESELTWALNNSRHTRADFGLNFSDIVYDHDRIKKDVYEWPGPTYALAVIKQSGGICVDQAYFAMICGKARGLPTLYFRGDGNTGGHAWFGYLVGKDRWSLDCGRYENQGYVVGHALDPQSWSPINDYQLKFLTENFRSRPEYGASRDDLVMARLLEARGQTARAARAYDSAIAVCPRNADAWDAKTDFLERTDAPLADLRAHHEAAAHFFSAEPDIKTAHQLALASLAQQAGDGNSARALQRQVTAQNENTRIDIAVAAEAERLKNSLAAKNYAESCKLYTQQLAALGPKAPLSFFRNLTVPLIDALTKTGDRTRAKAMLDQTHKTLHPDSGTTLADSLDQLTEAVNGDSARK